jgi:hypothetical protein
MHQSPKNNNEGSSNWVDQNVWWQCTFKLHGKDHFLVARFWTVSRKTEVAELKSFLAVVIDGHC